MELSTPDAWKEYLRKKVFADPSRVSWIVKILIKLLLINKPNDEDQNTTRTLIKNVHDIAVMINEIILSLQCSEIRSCDFFFLNKRYFIAHWKKQCLYNLFKVSAVFQFLDIIVMTLLLPECKMFCPLCGIHFFVGEERFVVIYYLLYRVYNLGIFTVFSLMDTQEAPAA